MEKLRENSDEESFEDEKEAALNTEKALLVDQMKEKVKNLQTDLKLRDSESKATVERYEAQL